MRDLRARQRHQPVRRARRASAALSPGRDDRRPYPRRPRLRPRPPRRGHRRAGAARPPAESRRGTPHLPGERGVRGVASRAARARHCRGVRRPLRPSRPVRHPLADPNGPRRQGDLPRGRPAGRRRGRRRVTGGHRSHRRRRRLARMDRRRGASPAVRRPAAPRTTPRAVHRRRPIRHELPRPDRFFVFAGYPAAYSPLQIGDEPAPLIDTRWHDLIERLVAPPTVQNG